jgi:molybdate transport repressor ModE-like protein
MLYDTVLLRTFVAICDSGSFTKAAREVNLTQSAVSLHVKRLEDQVGSRLIVRGARGVRLTEQGQVLLSYARRILALYNSVPTSRRSSTRANSMSPSPATRLGKATACRSAAGAAQSVGGRRAMQLRADEPAPLALYPPFCRWRQLAIGQAGGGSS